MNYYLSWKEGMEYNSTLQNGGLLYLHFKATEEEYQHISDDSVTESVFLMEREDYSQIEAALYGYRDCILKSRVVPLAKYVIFGCGFAIDEYQFSIDGFRYPTIYEHQCSRLLIKMTPMYYEDYATHVRQTQGESVPVCVPIWLVPVKLKWQVLKHKGMNRRDYANVMSLENPFKTAAQIDDMQYEIDIKPKPNPCRVIDITLTPNAPTPRNSYMSKLVSILKSITVKL